MMKHIESIISGRMLGFDFLSSIKKVADQLGIRGVAFAKEDGSIKVIAEGEEENLKEFTEEIKNSKGVYSRVENFYVEWDEPAKDFGDFYIIAH